MKLVWGIVQKEIEMDDIDNSYSDDIKLMVKELLSKVSFIANRPRELDQSLCSVSFRVK